MKECNISLTEAQKNLKSLPEQFSAECPAIIITHNNQPILSIMPYATHQALLADIESLQTLLKIVSGKEFMGTETVKQNTPKSMGLDDQGISWEEFQKEFGWE